MGPDTENSDGAEVSGRRAAEPASLIAKRLERAEQRIAELELALDVTGMYDSRTGARSRNALLDAIEYQARWCARHGTTFGVVVIHVPAAADGAHSAAVVAASLRSTDVVATWDEWTVGVVLPGLRPEAAPALWSRVAPNLTVADAVAVFPEEEVPADDLLIAAEDAALPMSGVTHLWLSPP